MISTTVKFVDGTLVDSASEAWRSECEARFVLGMQPKSTRQDFLAAVEKRRGKSAADKLRADVLALWSRR
jgi:hypothetical protein